MDARAEVQEILSEFARSIELEELSLDDNDSCRLGFDGDLFVDIDYDAVEHRLMMSTNLGSPPAASAADTYEAALRNNALWTERVATIAIDGATGQLMLLQPVAAGRLDAQAFAARLEGVVQAARGWRALVARAAADPDETSPAGQDVDGFAIKV